jgi:beta-glucanase (GH16 family)
VSNRRLNLLSLIRIGAALEVSVATCGLGVLAQPATAAADPVGWQTTFDDEFDGPAGTPPDPGRWQPDIGGTGWGNNELQFYTPRGNAFLDGQGHLVIEARPASADLNCWYGRCEYSSGKVTTHATFSQAYGRFEARIMAPGEPGLLPAFWMLGDNIDHVRHPAEGEIDVVETVGNQANRVQQHAHGPGLDFGYAYGLPAGQTITGWHTYAIEWSPDRIDWLVDGSVTRTLLRDQAGGGWVFDHPFFILLDLAVGGDWPGPPNDQTHFPARLLVDYVRVFRPGA